MAVQDDALIRDFSHEDGIFSNLYANLEASAQNGHGAHLVNIDGATPLVLPNVVPIVVHTPTMFKYYRNMDRICKNLYERCAKTIDGIDFGYEVDFNSTKIAHDSQEQFMPVQTRRTQVEPSYTWQEGLGNIVWNFHHTWINMFKNADTQGSLTTTAILDANDEIYPLVYSTFAMDILWIQYDTTFRPGSVLDAFFTVGMMPQMTGMFGFKREVGANQGMPERNVTHKCVLQHNRRTKEVGMDVAEIYGLHLLDYENATPVATQVADRIQNLGYQKEVDDALGEFRRPNLGNPIFSP